MKVLLKLINKYRWQDFSGEFSACHLANNYHDCTFGCHPLTPPTVRLCLSFQLSQMTFVDRRDSNISVPDTYRMIKSTTRATVLREYDKKYVIHKVKPYRLNAHLCLSCTKTMRLPICNDALDHTDVAKRIGFICCC